MHTLRGSGDSRIILSECIVYVSLGRYLGGIVELILVKDRLERGKLVCNSFTKLNSISRMLLCAIMYVSCH